MSFKAGARNSRKDQQHIQAAHDHLAALGAACAPPDDKTVPAAKDLALDELTQAVYTAFYALPHEPEGDTDGRDDCHIVHIYPDYLILQDGLAFYQATWSQQGAAIAIDPPSAWVAVEPSWEPVARPESEGKALDRSLLCVKALSDGRVGAYGVLFGTCNTPDLSAERDFFTKQTEYWLDRWTTRPMIYHHAMDPHTADDPVVGTWDSAKADDVGIWLEGQLDMGHKYRAAVQKLIDEGVLATSSDSAPHLVRRKKAAKNTHEITRWPLLAVSLTPTPAEPRLLPVTALKAAYKAAGIVIPQELEDQDVAALTVKVAELQELVLHLLDRQA